MTALLLSGLGPSFINDRYLAGSLFSPQDAPARQRDYYGGLGLEHLSFHRDGERHPLLRRIAGRGSSSLRIDGLDGITVAPPPHLTTVTLRSILDQTGEPYEAFDLAGLWSESREPETAEEDVDTVLLSTTFIWDSRSMSRAIEWVATRFPTATLILGGQYSNLKYGWILTQHPEVYAVLRGDAEEALPQLLRAVRGLVDWREVPNLVLRDDAGRLHQNEFRYIDIEAYPSPTMPGQQLIVPYESMRGCPFSCKFCSFPAASPTWRFKSARKIAEDWRRYGDVNGTRHIRASDSTFTTPPTRLRELYELLPAVGIGWEAFARANAIRDERTVESLAHAHCKWLSIGFESMSDHTLKLMKKQVTAAANRRAFELLRDSEVGYRTSFIIGYPGETPQDFAQTSAFLQDEYAGHFTLNVFSLQDETMPVWNDADVLGIHVDDLDNPDRSWRHIGMDVRTAEELMHTALRDIRSKSDTAVHLVWQKDYETPLMPWLSARTNLWLEKLVERFAMLPLTEPDAARGAPLLRGILGQLEREGIVIDDAAVRPTVENGA